MKTEAELLLEAAKNPNYLDDSKKELKKISKRLSEIADALMEAGFLNLSTKLKEVPVLLDAKIKVM
jgi:hypothetical protein